MISPPPSRSCGASDQIVDRFDSPVRFTCEQCRLGSAGARPEAASFVHGGKRITMYRSALISEVRLRVWISNLPLLTALLCAACQPREQQLAPASPEQAVAELLAADRAFAAAGAQADLVTALSATFADDVMLPYPADRFAEGKAAATELLRSTPANARARVEWAPVRGGISADGMHGFTLGYMTVQHPDSAAVLMKYLAYWLKGPKGWRIAALSRRRRPQGEVSLALMPALLPARMVAPSTDAARFVEFRASLADAEKSFSDYAQTAGLGPAFVRFGSPDAVNMGGPNDRAFVAGPDAIARSIGAGPGPSPVSWSASRTIVASSGDLGINFGLIRENAGSASSAPSRSWPFFTVWHRKQPSLPWRYVAE